MKIAFNAADYKPIVHQSILGIDLIYPNTITSPVLSDGRR